MTKYNGLQQTKWQCKYDVVSIPKTGDLICTGHLLMLGNVHMTISIWPEQRDWISSVCSRGSHLQVAQVAAQAATLRPL